MEYVGGTTLKDRLAQGRLPPEQAARIAAQVVEALESAHQHGLIHRDLKSSDIMLSSAGHAKVMDFGLAKRVPTATDAPTLTECTEPGMTVGTLAYMSPEELRVQDLFLP